MLIQLFMSLTLIANISGAQTARKVLVNITMISCGGQRNNVCVTAYTTTDNETAINQGDGFVQFDWVRYSGPTLNQYPACSIVFTGDQNIYPLSPHFGPFPECSNVMSAYRHQLADTLDKGNNSVTTFQPLGQNGCPIQSLPLNYDEYIACINAKFDTWYLFRFSTFLKEEDQNETSEVWYLAYATADGSISPAVDQHIRPLITLTAKCIVQALFPLKYPNVPFIVDLQVQISMQPSWNRTSTNDSQLPAMVATRSKRLSALDPWLLIEFPLNRNRQKLRICYRYHMVVTSAKFNTTVVPVNMKHTRCLDTYVEDCAAKSGATGTPAYSIISVNALLYTILVYFL